MKSQVRETMRKLVADKLALPMDEVRCDAAVSEYGADSLDAVELLIEMEQQFRIEIPDEDAQRFSTIEEAVTYIAETACPI